MVMRTLYVSSWRSVTQDSNIERLRNCNHHSVLVDKAMGIIHGFELRISAT